MHFELANGVVSLTTVDHLLHPQRFQQWMSAINGAISATKTAYCFNYGECFTATIPLHAVTKLDIALQAILWLIKARESRWKGGETRGKTRGEWQRKEKMRGECRTSTANAIVSSSSSSSSSHCHSPSQPHQHWTTGKKNPEKVTNKKVERKRRKQEASRRGWHHHQLSLLQNQEPDRARQGVAS